MKTRDQEVEEGSKLKRNAPCVSIFTTKQPTICCPTWFHPLIYNGLESARLLHKELREDISI
jgi:hypothetical protein